jgi:hypothetical protein
MRHDPFERFLHALTKQAGLGDGRRIDVQAHVHVAVVAEQGQVERHTSQRADRVVADQP